MFSHSCNCTIALINIHYLYTTSLQEQSSGETIKLNLASWLGSLWSLIFPNALFFMENNGAVHTGTESGSASEIRIPGGHWPRKGVWGCAAHRTSFSRLSCRSQGSHFKQESVHKTPFWENLEILASTTSIFTQILAHKPLNLEIFSSQAPKFGNFQLTSPQIWKFSTHKPPFSEANVSSQAPHFGNPGRTPLPEKKLSAPPGSGSMWSHSKARRSDRDQGRVEAKWSTEKLQDPHWIRTQSPVWSAPMRTITRQIHMHWNKILVRIKDTYLFCCKI